MSLDTSGIYEISHFEFEKVIILHIQVVDIANKQAGYYDSYHQDSLA